MSEKNDILIGKIVAPQGIRGEVRVQTYTESPNDLKTLAIFGNGISPQDFSFVRLLNPTSTVIIAKINGINDRTSAERLRGTELFVSRNALPDTKDGEYYQSDLIGFVVMRHNVKLGVVDCFQNFGAGDILQLDTGDLVSFIGADVDMANQIIYVK